MKEVLVFETYVQDDCNDAKFKDSHIQVFHAKKKHVKRAVKGLWGKGLGWFLDNYNYDTAEELYRLLDANGEIRYEYITRSAI